MSFKYKIAPKIEKGMEDTILEMYSSVGEQFKKYIKKGKKIPGMQLFFDGFCLQIWQTKDGDYTDVCQEPITMELDYMVDEEDRYTIGQEIVAASVVKLHKDGIFADIIKAYPFTVYIDVEEGEFTEVFTIENESEAKLSEADFNAIFKTDKQKQQFDAVFAPPQVGNIITLSSSDFTKVENSIHNEPDFDLVYNKLNKPVIIFDKPFDNLEVVTEKKLSAAQIKKVGDYLTWVASKPDYLRKFFKTDPRNKDKNWYDSLTICESAIYFWDGFFFDYRLIDPEGNKTYMQFEGKRYEQCVDEGKD